MLQSTSKVGVLIDGSLLTSETNSTPGTTLNWELFTVSFVATSASTVVGFENLDPSGDDSNGLDNISLALASTGAVPEPATPTLLALAFAGVGFARWRKLN